MKHRIEWPSWNDIDIRCTYAGIKIRLAPNRWIGFSWVEVSKLTRLSRKQGWILRWEKESKKEAP
jgi:hypothetical protein